MQRQIESVLEMQQKLTIDNESLWVVHALQIKPQVQRLQTPLLAVRDGLARGGNVRLGEEQAAKPHLRVVEVVERGDAVELHQAPRKIDDPRRDGHRLVHFITAPMVRDRAYYILLLAIALRHENELLPLVNALISVLR